MQLTSRSRSTPAAGCSNAYGIQDVGARRVEARARAHAPGAAVPRRRDVLRGADERAGRARGRRADSARRNAARAGEGALRGRARSRASTCCRPKSSSPTPRPAASRRRAAGRHGDQALRTRAVAAAVAAADAERHRSTSGRAIPRARGARRRAARRGPTCAPSTRGAIRREYASRWPTASGSRASPFTGNMQYQEDSFGNAAGQRQPELHVRHRVQHAALRAPGAAARRSVGAGADAPGRARPERRDRRRRGSSSSRRGRRSRRRPKS